MSTPMCVCMHACVCMHVGVCMHVCVGKVGRDVRARARPPSVVAPLLLCHTRRVWVGGR